MNIVVLAGGISTEREVSIVSGTQVCIGLRKKNHAAILVDVYCGIEEMDLDAAFTGECSVEEASAYMTGFNDRLDEMKKERDNFFGPNVLELCKKADIVFLALHGENGENGKIQATFDLMNIKYTGTGHLSSAMAMDKGITKQIFSSRGVPTPKGITILRENHSDQLADYKMDFPVVVKPCCGGSSVGVYIVDNQKDYEKALKDAFFFEEEVVVEEYIKGREFSVGVIDGKALPIIEIAPKQGFYDYKNKYEAGSTVETCPADLSSELTKRMQEYAVMGNDALAIESYGRLDFMMKENGQMYCLEANTLPGMTPTSLLPQEAMALGTDFPNLCDQLIQVSLKKYEG